MGYLNTSVFADPNAMKLTSVYIFSFLCFLCISCDDTVKNSASANTIEEETVDFSAKGKPITIYTTADSTVLRLAVSEGRSLEVHRGGLLRA